jgi:hypothetical protein
MRAALVLLLAGCAPTEPPATQGRPAPPPSLRMCPDGAVAPRAPGSPRTVERRLKLLNGRIDHPV